MCKRREYHRHTLALVSGGAYACRTTRLDASMEERWAQTSGREGQRACRDRGFPWWTLCLIWPLFFVLKTAVMIMTGAWAGVLAAVGAAGDLPAAIAAVALIVIGLWLVRR